jgi:mevalonate kinase
MPGVRAAMDALRRQWGRADDASDVELGCTVALGRGPGASAACGVAAVRAVADLYDRELDTESLYDAVQVAEQLTHGLGTTAFHTHHHHNN